MRWEHRKSDSEIANDVMRGVYGNGLARRAALTKAGYKYEDIQKMVNEKIRGGISSSDKKSKKSSKMKDIKAKKKEKTMAIVDAVIRGKYGNGRQRLNALTKAGYNYEKIQRMVNKKILGRDVRPTLTTPMRKRLRKRQVNSISR